MTRFKRWWWAGLALLMVAGFTRLRFNVEVLDLLPQDLPVVQGLKLYNENFTDARELLVTIHAPTAEVAEQAARAIVERLRRERELVASVTWQAPWQEHPEQAAEFFACLWLNQPPTVFGQLTNRLAEPQLSATLRSARARLAISLSPEDIGRLGYDPLELTRVPGLAAAGSSPIAQDQDYFASADGTFRVVFVQATIDLANYRECVRWLERIKGAVDSAVTAGAWTDQLKIAYTGRPAFVAEIAGGMERDIAGSVGGTAVVIAILFWIAHRRLRPLLWLLALLALVLAGTLGLGGLLFGTLNVMSVGFAAIVLGLAVDYGLVLYQEARGDPTLARGEGGGAKGASQRPKDDWRRCAGLDPRPSTLGFSHSSPLTRGARLAPSIVYAALTTAAAFGVLNLSGLPGLAQLGSLVAIGVIIAAAVMLNWYLPPLVKVGQASRLSHAHGTRAEDEETALVRRGRRDARPTLMLAWVLTALVLLGAGAILSRGLPPVDHSADALRPRESAAYSALEEVKRLIGPAAEPLWLLVAGRAESDVAERLDAVTPILARAQADGQISSFNSPAPLWPRPGRQQANREAVARLLSRREAIQEAAARQGFTPGALSLTEGMLDTWQRAFDTTNTFWPTNAMSRWILDKLSARTPEALYALTLVYPAEPLASGSSLRRRGAELGREGVWLTSWEVLGETLLEVVKRDLRRVLVPLFALLCAALALAFRRAQEVFLSLATLVFTGLALLAIMKLAGWSWNLMNLTALPLLLGMSVDYSIHMQWALRRHGDVAKARRITGRALLLCGATTMAGLGSLAWSSNAGMASLGKVCATGIGCAMLTSVFLLPAWWRTLTKRTETKSLHGCTVTRVE